MSHSYLTTWNGTTVVDLPGILGIDLARTPHVLRHLIENVVRTGGAAQADDVVREVRAWLESGTSEAEVPFLPQRLLMHDTTSTPALVDVAAMRDVLARHGVDPAELSPTLPIEISVDHSLAVEEFGRADAPVRNVRFEMRRNRERYSFLKWASSALDGVHVNPPGTGIMHTINLEQLATVVTTEERDGTTWTMPDHMLGTDSHTPMINGLGVLGWGIGGLEAETIMFGMPTTLRLPDVVGVRLTGRLGGGAMATDFALVVTQRLRDVGVTGEFVEFFGPGVATLTVGDRGVVANMAPEYGATTGFFPIDDHTLDYLRATGRTDDTVGRVEGYATANGLWFDPDESPRFTRTVDIDLSDIRPYAAGPRRPQDLLPLSRIPEVLAHEPRPPHQHAHSALPAHPVALAAITSCTNTTDPRLLVAAGLLARRARALGLRVPQGTKTSLSPGSPAAASYLQRGGLLDDLSVLGFDIVGYGCATCIGNPGPLTPEVIQARDAGESEPVAILSGNRNFPGRVHPEISLGFIMSPPLVVAMALAGDASIDLAHDPVQTRADGTAVHLADLWPADDEIDRLVAESVAADDFRHDFSIASASPLWAALDAPAGPQYPWDPASTILRPPPFAAEAAGSLLGEFTARPLLVLGDDITTDHISPASAIPRDSFVADFLVDRGDDRDDLNVFASRRGNWEVMMRGAYFNRNVRSAIAPNAPTGHGIHQPSGDVMPLHALADRYRDENVPVIVIAGERYGMGSSRDWAAKAQRLLGVRAVLARSFERIHRTNLIGMGILPVLISDEAWPQFQGIDADATVTVNAATVAVRGHVSVTLHSASDSTYKLPVAVETDLERRQLESGGVIPLILSEYLRPAG